MIDKTEFSFVESFYGSSIAEIFKVIDDADLSFVELIGLISLLVSYKEEKIKSKTLG